MCFTIGFKTVRPTRSEASAQAIKNLRFLMAWSMVTCSKNLMMRTRDGMVTWAHSIWASGVNRPGISTGTFLLTKIEVICYIPRTHLTSIFEGAFSNQNRGHLGSRLISLDLMCFFRISATIYGFLENSLNIHNRDYQKKSFHAARPSSFADISEVARIAS